jgi:hypothetical protein
MLKASSNDSEGRNKKRKKKGSKVKKEPKNEKVKQESLVGEGELERRPKGKANAKAKAQSDKQSFSDKMLGTIRDCRTLLETIKMREDAATRGQLIRGIEDDIKNLNKARDTYELAFLDGDRYTMDELESMGDSLCADSNAWLEHCNLRLRC